MTRTVLRWTHLMVGWPIGVFGYTPMREDETFVLLMQVAFVPAVVLTGVWSHTGRVQRYARSTADGRSILEQPMRAHVLTARD